MAIELLMTVGSMKELRATNTVEAAKLHPLKRDMEVVVKISSRKKRGLRANALFHKWCEEASVFFGIKRMGKHSPESRMKLVFKHTFLGYEADKIGTVDIQPQLIKTSSLDTGEFCLFMEQVQAWCAEKGCPLSNPADNEYQKWQQEQNK